MTRIELLRILIGQARANGFEFRRWYTSRLELPWINADAALAMLISQRRYYALLFSHEFASTFWKPGSKIMFQMKPQSFERRMADGSIRTVERKSFMRRSSRPDTWRYHLRHMAMAEEPLRYMLRYLHVEEDDIDEAESQTTPEAAPPVRPTVPRALQLARSAAEKRAEKAKATAKVVRKGAGTKRSAPSS